jgi:N6-adenosine-specific RNA methylase IME4
MILFPDKKYKTILVDPPWKYGRSWDTGSIKSAFGKKYNVNSYPMPYKEMTTGEIASLDLPSLFDDNCDVYLWATQKYLQDAFYVLDAWGLLYCQTLTWCKTPMGTGQGGLFCPTTEFLILGRKGRMPLNKARHDSTWWNIKRTNKHSKKPEFFQDIIETVSDPPRIELFARRVRTGWDCWGDEIVEPFRAP